MRKISYRAEQRIHKILRFSGFKYPKLFLLVLTIVFGYALVKYEFFGFGSLLDGTGYLGTLIAGIFFSYGFTASVATAFFFSIGQHQNIFIAASVGGIGALIGDTIIFYYLRFKCDKELQTLSREHLLQAFSRHIPSPIKKYLLVALGGLIIASPLPDEFGVSLLAAANIVSTQYFAIISFVLNTLGILAVLMLGSIA